MSLVFQLNKAKVYFFKKSQKGAKTCQCFRHLDDMHWSNWAATLSSVSFSVLPIKMNVAEFPRNLEQPFQLCKKILNIIDNIYNMTGIRDSHFITHLFQGAFWIDYWSIWCRYFTMSAYTASFPMPMSLIV